MIVASWELLLATLSERIFVPEMVQQSLYGILCHGMEDQFHGWRGMYNRRNFIKDLAKGALFAHNVETHHSIATSINQQCMCVWMPTAHRSTFAVCMWLLSGVCQISTSARSVFNWLWPWWLPMKSHLTVTRHTTA